MAYNAAEMMRTYADILNETQASSSNLEQQKRDRITQQRKETQDLQTKHREEIKNFDAQIQAAKTAEQAQIQQRRQMPQQAMNTTQNYTAPTVPGSDPALGQINEN